MHLGTMRHVHFGHWRVHVLPIHEHQPRADCNVTPAEPAGMNHRLANWTRASPPAALALTADHQCKHQPTCSSERVAVKRRAKSARLSGRPQLALEILLEGLKQFPDDLHLIAAASSTAAKLGDTAMAFSILAQALQEQPHNVHLLTSAAKAYAASGDIAAAKQCLHAAAAAQPCNPVVLQCWGVLEASCGNTDTAINLFKQALAADSRHIPVYVAWATVEVQRGKVKEARLLHQQGHQIDAQHVPNLHTWAELESSEGQWLLSIKLLEAALQIDPHHLPSWMALGKAHWSLGDSAAARRVYKTACRTLGPVPQLLNQWATLERQSQRVPAARAVLGFLDKALEMQHRREPSDVYSQSTRHAPEHMQQHLADDTWQRSQQQQQQQQQRQPQQQQPEAMQASGERDMQADGIAAQQQHCQWEPHEYSSSTDTHHMSARETEGFSTVAGLNCAEQLTEELQQQLDQLVVALDTQGLRATAATTAAAEAEQSGALELDRRSSRSSDNNSSKQANSSDVAQRHQQEWQSPSLQQAVSSNSRSVTAVPALAATPKGLVGHIPALVSAAVMEDRAGNTAKALRLFRSALATDPTNPKLLHALAQLHLRRGDRSAAEGYLDDLEQLDPGNGYLCHSRGILAQQEGQLAEAREWFERGLSAEGSRPALLNCEALAELQVFLGDVSGARATLSAGLTSRRPTARFLRVAGLVEKRLGNIARAAQLLARAVAREPRDYKSWLAWAVLERRRGDFAAAARCFKRGTACAPRNPHIWYAWAGMTWRDCRDHRAARRLYEQATTYCPRNAPLWMEWAMLEWDEGHNPDRARQLFQAGADVPVSYQHPPLYQAWAEREAAAGNHDIAQQLTARSYRVAKSMKQHSRATGKT